MEALSEVCTHVAAVLFYLRAHPSSGTEQAPTSTLVKWPVPSLKQVDMEGYTHPTICHICIMEPFSLEFPSTEESEDLPQSLDSYFSDENAAKSYDLLAKY